MEAQIEAYQALHTLSGFALIGIILIFLAIGYKETHKTHAACKELNPTNQQSLSIAQKLTIVIFLLFVFIMIAAVTSVGTQL